jgi:hypothetical protein
LHPPMAHRVRPSRKRTSPRERRGAWEAQSCRASLPCPQQR